VIGKEVKEQLFLKEKKLPDYLVACVGGGSNAMGLFHAFYEDNKVEFIGVEAGGIGDGKGEHAASLVKGSLGVLHGSLSYLLQDENGQILTTHSIAPGLDYPGVGPEHSFYKLTKRAKYFAVSDREAIKGFYLLAKLEGILPALEPAHAIFFVYDYFRKNKITDKIIVINLSGRGDKDLEIVMKYKE
jgi:tryptophan synthase beta chain